MTDQQTKTEEQTTRIAEAQGDIAQNEAFISNTEHDAMKYRTNDIKKAASNALDINLQRQFHDSLQLDIDTEAKRRVSGWDSYIRPYAQTVGDVFEDIGVPMVMGGSRELTGRTPAQHLENHNYKNRRRIGF